MKENNAWLKKVSVGVVLALGAGLFVAGNIYGQTCKIIDVPWTRIDVARAVIARDLRVDVMAYHSQTGEWELDLRAPGYRKTIRLVIEKAENICDQVVVITVGKPWGFDCLRVDVSNEPQ